MPLSLEPAGRMKSGMPLGLICSAQTWSREGPTGQALLLASLKMTGASLCGVTGWQVKN